MALGRLQKQKCAKALTAADSYELLQVPTASLEERIKRKAGEPCPGGIGRRSWWPVWEWYKDEDDSEGRRVWNGCGSEDEYENIDINYEYVGDEDGEITGYKVRDDAIEMDDNKVVPLFGWKPLFMNAFCWISWALVKLDDKQRKIAEQVVGSIDDDGYTVVIHQRCRWSGFPAECWNLSEKVESVIRLVQRTTHAGCRRTRSAGMPAVTIAPSKLDGKTVKTKPLKLLTYYFAVSLPKNTTTKYSVD